MNDALHPTERFLAKENARLRDELARETELREEMSKALRASNRKLVDAVALIALYSKRADDYRNRCFILANAVREWKLNADCADAAYYDACDLAGLE